MTVHDTWDTLGMRATQSNDFTLEDVFVPDETVFHTLPVDHFDPSLIRTVWGWSMPVFGSVYLGVALAGVECVRDMVARRNWESRPIVQHVFAQIEILVETSRAVIRSHVQDYMSGRLHDDLPIQQALSKTVLAKYVAVNNAVEIMELVMQLAGGFGYFRRGPIERHYRDVRAGPVHPFTNFDALDLFGKTALDIEIRPALDPAQRPLLQALRADSDGSVSVR